jgi:outer membrane protein assembly factor BamB
MGQHSASANALWERAGFYVTMDKRESGPPMVSFNYLVAVITNCNSVVALDGRTGEEIWTYNSGNLDELAISPTAVFVGDGAYVTALDVKTGDVLWSTRMPYGKGATILHVQGDTLYAGFNTGLSYVLFDALTGEVLDGGSSMDGKFPPSEIYPARELQATLGFHPIVGNTVYWGNEESVGAKDIPSGNILWRYEIPLISPIAVAGKSIYAISENGKLMRFDTATGAASVMISYTPAPLARLTESEADLYRNFVAADPMSNMVYVYMGDSETLMAYQLKP